MTFSLPETHFFVVLDMLKFAPDQVINEKMLRSIAETLHSFAGLDIEPTIYAELLQVVDERSAQAHSVWTAIVNSYRPRLSSGSMSLRVIEKTPLHVLQMPAILTACPTANFVNLIRDPVDVVASWMRTPFASSLSVKYYAHQWLQCVSAAELFSQLATG